MGQRRELQGHLRVSRPQTAVQGQRQNTLAGAACVPFAPLLLSIPRSSPSALASLRPRVLDSRRQAQSTVSLAPTGVLLSRLPPHRDLTSTLPPACPLARRPQVRSSCAGSEDERKRERGAERASESARARERERSKPLVTLLPKQATAAAMHSAARNGPRSSATSTVNHAPDDSCRFRSALTSREARERARDGEESRRREARAEEREREQLQRR